MQHQIAWLTWSYVALEKKSESALSSPLNSPNGLNGLIPSSVISGFLFGSQWSFCQLFCCDLLGGLIIHPVVWGFKFCWSNPRPSIESEWSWMISRKATNATVSIANGSFFQELLEHQNSAASRFVAAPKKATHWSLPQVVSTAVQQRFWVNCNDQSLFSPWNHGFFQGNHPQMAQQFRLVKYGYGSIPIIINSNGMNIHKSQLFWGSLGARVLTHLQIL